MIVMDSHVLIWLDEGNERLGKRSRKVLDTALRDDQLAVSAISFWEIAMLIHKERLRMTLDIQSWRKELLGLGVRELPISGDIGIDAASLTGFHGDPADRLIVATAIIHNGILLTSDDHILKWRGPGQRKNARA